MMLLTGEREFALFLSDDTSEKLPKNVIARTPTVRRGTKQFFD